MFLKSLALKNFRNYENEEFRFHKGLNVIHGENGQGKTNLLEALYFISTGRSFRTPHLSELIKSGERFFYLEAHFVKEGIPSVIKVGYEESSRRVEFNHSTLASFSSLLGIVPSVVFSPRDFLIIAGSPADRRRFLNLYLSQIDPLYVSHLLRYQRALKHRNTLLKSKKTTSIDAFEIEMSKSSLYIMNSRKKALEDLQKVFEGYEIWDSIKKEEYNIKYNPSFSLTKELSSDSICKQFLKIRKKELIYGTTLIGPHRDDLRIEFDKSLAKSFASEGQKQSFTLTLKFSEWQLLKENHKIDPLFFIDDFGLHLDQTRQKLMQDKLNNLGQTFVTTPSKELFQTISDKHKSFEIVKGKPIVS